MVFAEGTDRIETTILTRDGQRSPHLFSAKLIEAGRVPVLCGFAIEITRRRAAEDALTESQRFLETLVSDLPGVVYRCSNDPDWTVYFMSEACMSLIGYTSQEIIGPDPPILGELVHVDDRDRIWDTVQEALRRNESYQMTYRLAHREGGFRWVWDQGRGVFDGDGSLIDLKGFITDITEHKQARDHVQRLANRLHATLESITDAFITLDFDWRCTYANREAERVLMLPRESLTGSVFWDALPDLRGSSLERQFRQPVDEGVSRRFEHHRDATGRWHELNLYPSDEGLTVYFRDTTREKRDREQIEFLALYAPVTHLPNRQLLEDRIHRAIATSRRNATQAALLFIDLDDFKSVNDAFGHDQGDVLLRQVARRLGECLRANDTIARFGGDEFVVVLEGFSTEHGQFDRDTRSVATKIGSTLARPYQLGEQTCHTSASIGIADSLQLDVVAEGVETEAARGQLAALGCRSYQGFLFARPMPAGEFETLIGFGG